MKTSTLKVVPIGNSRGVRLPSPMLNRYRIKMALAVEERPEGILLKPVRDDRLSWEETAKAMVAARVREGDEFADEEKAAVADGLDELDR
ncbi:MAG: AbrB/MazE/SpoVT family DNA-binding domain-containing protein [Opitutaceae bacterium]|nr:AbrB/MazE/SpoVT family DNA-binding domain-containing protein [Opitutaceae bacterium]